MSDQTLPDDSALAAFDAFAKRLRSDTGLRESFLADPAGVLHELGLRGSREPLGRPTLIDLEDRTEVSFVAEFTAEMASAANGFPDITSWPRRQYVLNNHTGVRLNLESWSHNFAGIGWQEKAVTAEPGETGRGFTTATTLEETFRICNNIKGSFLVRDLSNGNVIAESWDIQCGPTMNVWTVYNSDGRPGFDCFESHPINM